LAPKSPKLGGNDGSRSVGAQIAEAWGKRRYEKHFVSKLSDADAERLETEHWVVTAKTTNYVNHTMRRNSCGI